MNASPAALLTIWVIYRSTEDHPGKYVLRGHDIAFTGDLTPRDEHTLHDSLASARIAPAESGLSRVPRYKDDDPRIVECWV